MDDPIPRKKWMCLLWIDEKPIKAFDRIDDAYKYNQHYYDGDAKLTYSLISTDLLVLPKGTYA